MPDLLIPNRLRRLLSLGIVFYLRVSTAQSADGDTFASAYRAGKCDAAIATVRNAAPSLSLGRCLMDAREYKPAADVFSNYLKSKPNDAIALVLRAKALQADGKGDDALSELQAFLKSNPAEAEVEDAVGDVLVNMDKSADAAEQYNAVLTRHPEDPGARIGLGLVALKEQRWADAIQEFEKARTLVPENATALRGIGNAYLQMKNCGQAAVPLREALRLSPDDFVLAKVVAGCYVEMKKWQDVWDVLRTGTAAEGADEEATAEVVSAAQALGRQDAVIEYLRAAAPSNVLAHVDLANIYYDRKQVQEARTQYVAAVKLRPDLVQVNTRLGDMALADKSAVEARKYYEAAAASKAATDEVRMKLARLCFDGDDFECAKTSLAVISDPHFARESDTMRARMAFKAKNWKEAAQYSDKLLASDRNNVEILKISAGAKKQESADPDNLFDAADVYEEALKLAPKDKDLRYQIVEIYENAKDTSRLARARDLLVDFVTNIEQDAQAYLLLGNVYYLMKDTGNATANFTKGFSLLPSPIPSYLTWAFTSYANLLIDGKNYEEARVQLTRGLGVDQNDESALYTLGVVCVQLKRPDEANQALAKLTELKSVRAQELQTLIERTSARKSK